jgi:hypothetical protein
MKVVLKECFIEVDGVNFSDHISSVTINLSKEEIDTTNFGGAGKERAHGLRDDSFELNFQQDFDAASVDATLYPLYDEETEFNVTVRPRPGAASATNPEYSGTCILLEYSPLDGSVGELSETSVTFPSQRDGITRSTTGS